MKKKIIILSSYFPPIISVASNRMYSFANYLDKNQFEVVVVFPYNKEVENKNSDVFVIPIKNTALLKYASFSKNLPYLLHKLKAVWNRLLILANISPTGNFDRKAYQVICSQIHEASTCIILSSSPHIETHIIAQKIKTKFPRIKWIADLRDALSNNSYIPNNQTNKHIKVELLILAYADAITTVSLPIVNNLEEKNYRKIPIVELRNGFDFEARLRFHFNERFTLLHAGTFYANRTPDTFFKAMQIILKEQLISDFRLVFVGSTSAIKIPEALLPYVERYDKIPYNEVVKLIQLADGLLLIHPPSSYKGVFTGKLFDYLGAMRPIIAIVDKTDVAAQLINEANAGFVADFYSVDEIKKAILDVYHLWKNKHVLPYHQQLIMMHHRAYQVKLLEYLIRQLYHEH